MASIIDVLWITGGGVKNANRFDTLEYTVELERNGSRHHII